MAIADRVKYYHAFFELDIGAKFDRVRAYVQQK